MNTAIHELVLLNQQEAQAILDLKDPGCEIAVTKSGYSVVLDPDKNVLYTIHGWR